MNETPLRLDASPPAADPGAMESAVFAFATDPDAGPDTGDALREGRSDPPYRQPHVARRSGEGRPTPLPAARQRSGPKFLATISGDENWWV